MKCEHCDYSPDQCQYAMIVLLQRLIDDGYIRDDRKQNLTERMTSMSAGYGFITKTERKLKQEEEDLLS